jgi:hypothetical protein
MGSQALWITVLASISAFLALLLLPKPHNGGAHS